MRLLLDSTLATGYTSRSQIARRVSENWAVQQLYCPACPSDRLTQSPNNTPAVDFVCPECRQSYQLKSSARWSERKVMDAAYDKMIDAIQSDTRPNLLVMQYSPSWHVNNLLLVPAFFFTESAIQKRNPLGPKARQAGWIGCNILLSNIAEQGKLHLISNGIPADASDIRHQYQRVQPLKTVSITRRGWTLDVMNIISQFRQQPFTLQDVYAFESHLAALHTDNRHVRDKIRQQLQVLRDLGLLRFLGHGKYVLNPS